MEFPPKKHKSPFTTSQMAMCPGSLIVVPVHIQWAKAALHDAGIPVATGNQALDLATTFYNATPQISQTDALRQERNRIQDELETVSSQLLQERRKTLRLEQELTAARQLPKAHQNKSYKLRKQLRAILAVLEHPQAKETAKLKSITKLVTGVLEWKDNPEQNS